MEIAAIPDDYFNTREYFRAKDRKYRDKGYIVDRYGRPVRKKKVLLHPESADRADARLAGADRDRCPSDR